METISEETSALSNQGKQALTSDLTMNICLYVIYRLASSEVESRAYCFTPLNLGDPSPKHTYH